jgi:iron(III) transport system substrate-binding protein
MLDKLASGEYLIGYFVSGPVILPQMAQLDKVVGWSLISDATPLFLRGMAIPAKSPHPNTGKLMLDYILSAEGQANIAGGGFTPYRAGVTAPAGRPTYESVLADVGRDNVVVIGYDLGSEAEQDRFTKDWEGRLG